MFGFYFHLPNYYSTIKIPLNYYTNKGRHFYKLVFFNFDNRYRFHYIPFINKMDFSYHLNQSRVIVTNLKDLVKAGVNNYWMFWPTNYLISLNSMVTL